MQNIQPMNTDPLNEHQGTPDNNANAPASNEAVTLTPIEKFREEYYSSSIDLEELEYQRDREKKAQARKDMIYGALWCIGGTIFTVADTGFIFWGAILFGGIQFFKGLANYN